MGVLHAYLAHSKLEIPAIFILFVDLFQLVGPF